MPVVVSSESRLPTGEQAVEKRQSRYQGELRPQPTRSPVDNTRRYGQHQAEGFSGLYRVEQRARAA